MPDLALSFPLFRPLLYEFSLIFVISLDPIDPGTFEARHARLSNPETILGLLFIPDPEKTALGEILVIQKFLHPRLVYRSVDRINFPGIFERCPLADNENIFPRTDDHAADRKNQPSLSQLEPRRRFPLFDDLHANRRLQGADIRGEEGSEEIDRNYT